MPRVAWAPFSSRCVAAGCVALAGIMMDRRVAAGTRRVSRRRRVASIGDIACIVGKLAILEPENRRAPRQR
ncbi:MAG: hypothetical protein FWD17_13690 [Polyangiaceae bacterium]|nr:hypothetical protein [Polyangiaceae bacterium]